jgi:hypothetical protein
VPLDACIIELAPFTWKSEEYERLSAITGRSYRFWQNENKSNHREFGSCPELDRRQSHTEPNICRAGASETVVDIAAIVDIVKETVLSLKKLRSNQ